MVMTAAGIVAFKAPREDGALFVNKDQQTYCEEVRQWSSLEGGEDLDPDLITVGAPDVRTYEGWCERR